MGSPLSVPDLPDFSAVFRAAAGPAGRLSFARFMELALYHPQAGYYRRDRPRVGYGRGTDFYTASTSGPVFGELVAAACVDLLDGRDPRAFTFVEIGPEPLDVARDRPLDSAQGRPGSGVLAGVAHPFGIARTVRVGEPLALSGRCIVFSNELFDAQPFRRLVRRGGAWHELGVALDGDALVEADLGPREEPALPAGLPEGYHLDLPQAAARLVEAIAAQPWSGLFLALDYGKSWAELCTEHPAGTARAYYRHTQSSDLLARPGEQDLTCHVCWDWIRDALQAHGFGPARLEAQEAFFMRHAAAYLEPALQADAARLTPRKRSLMQLLHPAHLGRKFQALHAWRGGREDSP